MITRLAADQELERIQQLFCIAFEMSCQGEVPPEPDPRVHTWAAFTDDNQMMSCLMVTDFTQMFDGHGCKMGGIGAVSTLPEYRRRGGIRGCFEASLPWMYDQGYELSYLYPFSTAYYRKFGYENCVQRFQTVLNPGMLQPRPVPGHVALAERHRPLTDAIRAVDQQWVQRFNLTVLHREDDYDWTREPEPAKKPEFTYVYFDGENRPTAFTTFHLATEPDGRNLICTRFAFLNREGYDGLMHLFKSLAADHTLVKLDLPAVTALQYLMPEWSMGAASWAMKPAGMARVINAESLLKKARYQGSGRAVLQLQDDQIRQNNKTFLVTFADGQARSVEETDEAPDAVLTIAAFSALLCGVSDFREAAAWLPGITVCRENPALTQVFYRKPMYLTDYF